jgi:CubicO group peptidase (beta-lactamase class C family)
MTTAGLDAAKKYSLETGVTTLNGTPRTEAGYVIRHGKLVYFWGNDKDGFDMKSTTKSMGGLALFLALDEGKLALTDKAVDKLTVPAFGTDPLVTVNAGNLADITIQQLATHTAGFSKLDVPPTTPRTLDYVPGTTWAYSDQGLNWLADVLTQTYNQDLNVLMGTRVFTPLGIRANTDVKWRDNQGRSLTLNGVPRRELASGINANVNAMARIGLLMLREGAWAGTQLLSKESVSKAHTVPAEVGSATIARPDLYPFATTNYGILWWTNAEGHMAGVPRDAYWAWGLHETFIIVIPSQDLVIARAASNAGWHNGTTGTPDSWAETWDANYSILEPFLTPISQSVTGP